ncbi:MAG TPA: glycosyltransferase [Thermogutta sp.]|nr:glycosyltransferase [Thermogutta sp.]
MRILFVAVGGSIHTARWIDQLTDRGWDLHLFPTELYHLRPELKGVTIHDVEDPRRWAGQPGVTLHDRFYAAFGRDWALPFGRYRASQWITWWQTQFANQAWRLARLIDRLRPDIVHSLGLHLGGYLTLAAREECRKPFPTWVVTNWGSDLFLFGRLTEHKERLAKVLNTADYYWCECQRDVELAKSWGVPSERILPTVPAPGGFDIEQAEKLRTPGPTSSRRVITVKGYQDWAGRALVAFQALRGCSDLLAGYRIAVYTGGRDPEPVRIAGELLSQDLDIPVTFVPPRTPHEAMLRLHGQSRISIGLSISDSIAISLLEAMLMGSFPIQSNTGAAYEWIEDGKTGLIVPPEDPHAVTEAIRRALWEDHLVDSASAINQQVIAERCERRKIAQCVVSTYERICQ